MLAAPQRFCQRAARARVRRLQAAVEQSQAFVVEARLTAAKLQLARLCIERQRVKAELQAGTDAAGPPGWAAAAEPLSLCDT
jgi:hypothetical protein